MADKEKDLALLKAWKKGKSPADLQALFTQFNGTVQKEVNRWSGVLARDVLELEALRLAKQAFENYDPNAGASLNTHLTNYLQKLSRLTYTHQNAARTPEFKTLKIPAFQRAHSELETQFGRPPNLDELADHLSWSKAAVKEMRGLIKREEIESVGSEASMPMVGISQPHDHMIDYLYHDFDPESKAIFEATTGYGGATVLSGAELMKKLKLTQGQLSFKKQKMVKRIQEVTGGK